MGPRRLNSRGRSRRCVPPWTAPRRTPLTTPTPNPNASAGLTPKYQAIAVDLAAKIRAGELSPGSALPPQRELSQTYGVTLVTLRQALQRLEDDGVLSPQP